MRNCIVMAFTIQFFLYISIGVFYSKNQKQITKYLYTTL